MIYIKKQIKEKHKLQPEPAMTVMTKAHQIRKAAAAKFNCKVPEIHFGECLRIAHSMERKTTEVAKAVAEVIANVKKTSEAHEVTEISEAIYTDLAKIYVYCMATGRGHKDSSFQSTSALYRGGISAYSFDPIKNADSRINSDFGQNAISEINKKMEA